MKKISVCVACYNEEGNINELYDRICKSIEPLCDYEFEILFEDNDSTDNTQNILRDIAGKDKRVKVIFNQRNYGVSLSVQNLMRRFTGDAYFAIAADIQDPPELIPTIIEEWAKGYKIVWGQRKKTEESVFRNFCKKIYYGIIRRFSESNELSQVNGFGLMDREVVESVLPRMQQDASLSVRHLVTRLGYEIKLIPYVHMKRKNGKSSYNMSRYFEFAIASLVNTSIRPLHIMTIGGFVASVMCAIIGIVYLLLKIIYWSRYSAGIAPIIISLFFASSLQLFFLGMLGEYMSVLIRRVTVEDKLIEKETINM